MTRKIFLFLLLVSWPLLWASWGCDSEPPVTVDFSQTDSATRKTESMARPTLRAAVGAMVSPKETYEIYRQLFLYVSRRVNMELDLVQRKTYTEINELIGKQQLDLAFLCSGPYVSGRESMGLELLVAPQVQGGHEYRAYLIVGDSSPFTKLEDLMGRSFAFTDPASNTGRLVPAYWLAQTGQKPESFFSEIIYTYSHDNSILAVARGLVDGATVDSLIWDYYNQRDPVFTSRTRIIRRSKPFGIPPLVVPGRLDPQLKGALRDIFLNMHLDPEGQAILKSLMIDRFVIAKDEWYESLAELTRNANEAAREDNEIKEP